MADGTTHTHTHTQNDMQTRRSTIVLFFRLVPKMFFLGRSHKIKNCFEWGVGEAALKLLRHFYAATMTKYDDGWSPRVLFRWCCWLCGALVKRALLCLHTHNHTHTHTKKKSLYAWTTTVKGSSTASIPFFFLAVDREQNARGLKMNGFARVYERLFCVVCVPNGLANGRHVFSGVQLLFFVFVSVFFVGGDSQQSSSGGITHTKRQAMRHTSILSKFAATDDARARVRCIDFAAPLLLSLKASDGGEMWQSDGSGGAVFCRNSPHTKCICLAMECVQWLMLRIDVIDEFEIEKNGWN